MPARTLYVSPLPATASNKRLEEIFSEIGPVKQCFVVNEKGSDKCRGFGYVTYSMEEDSQRALKEVKEYDGKRLSVILAKRKIKEKRKTEKDGAPKEKDAALKVNEQNKSVKKVNLKPRLIIRNLSFKCSEDDLKQILSKFGTVLEAKIPLKPDGKMRGFAFVLFQNLFEAGKALHALNLKEIKGRQVAIDWAVPKEQFIATQPPSSAGTQIIEATAKKSDAKTNAEDKEEKKPQAAPAKKRVPSKSSVKQVEESEADDDDDDDDDASEDQDSEVEVEEEVEEEEEDEDSDMKEEEDEEEEEDDDDMSQEEEDDSEDDNSSFDSNDDDDEEDDEDMEADKPGNNSLLMFFMFCM
ncbi:RNA-binding protein 28 [Liparis tanakae]|uniref:RNA-binding protein 28 n=1 Tax=Liparis tanakae TaxID=230148 RepID=A0A4Z2J9X3_9TELE|nr:RNA-binding protein 28 [Liparis tanakae]